MEAEDTLLKQAVKQEQALVYNIAKRKPNFNEGTPSKRLRRMKKQIEIFFLNL